MNYEFHINEFEGPLDLLLHFVRESKMDLYEIKVTDVINQYLDYINEQEKLNIDIASEYLVMASELIHLKSKILINKTDDEDEEFEINSEEALKNKLLEYQKYKDVTEEFKNLEYKRSEVFTKFPENLNDFCDENEKLTSDMSGIDLYNALLTFLEKQKYNKPLNTKYSKKEISVAERTKSIRNILKDKSKVNFFDLFDVVTKEYVIVTFLSVLEMSKDNEINIIQENNFSPIIIESRCE